MVGRKDERARLKALLDAAREGRSGTLLLHGPPGIGKTELLRYAIEEAAGLPAAAGARHGVRVRHPVRRAGRAGHAAARAPRRDPGGAGRRRCAARWRSARRRPPTASRCPPRCCRCSRAPPTSGPCWRSIDDAQWLDDPSLEAFLFAGRRLGPGGRGDDRRRARRRAAGSRCRGWTGCAIEPLPDDEARALLDAGDRAGRRRPARRHRGRQPARAAGDPRPAVRRASSPGASRSRTRCGPAPASSARSRPRSRRCPDGDAARAAGRRRGGHAAAGRDRPRARRTLGLSLIDLEPAEAARIVALAEGELEFRHPLMRSTVYHAASLSRAPRARTPRWPRRPRAPSARGTSRPARSRPTRRSPPRWSGRARRPRPRRARHRGARPRPRRAAHAGRRAARARGCWPRPATRSAAARPSARSGCSTRRPR